MRILTKLGSVIKEVVRGIKRAISPTKPSALQRTKKRPSSWARPKLSRDGKANPHQVAPDFLGVVVFGSNATEALPLMSVGDDRVFPAIARISANAGSTQLDLGLQRAYTMLANMDKSLIKRVCVISDGEATCNLSALLAIAQKCKRANIRIDTAAIGNSGEPILRAISKASAGGEFQHAKQFASLERAVIQCTPKNHLHRRRGATVLLLDGSASMNGSFGGQSRIDACKAIAKLFAQAQRRLYGHKVS
jgi:uncharacterized protein YegL